MASYNTNDFRSGLKIMLDGEPAVINIYHEGFKITRLADNFADFVRNLREG